MQQFESRGKTYNLPDTATHAATGSTNPAHPIARSA